MSAHTPGPWKTERVDSGPVGSRNLVYFRVKSTRGYVAGTSVYCSEKNGATVRIDNAECDANARLIAAAPDLLEALETLLAAPLGGLSSDEFVTRMRARATATAAIAKARGTP